MKKLSFLFIFISIIACKEQRSEKMIPVEPDNGIGDGATPPPVFSFSKNMEEAHNKEAFMSKEAISFDINLKFDGATRLNGKVSMTTNSTKVKLDKLDGTSIVYDGKDLYISPDTSKVDDARFDIFTWQYFFAMPFKLTDPGTIWDTEKQRDLDSLQYDTARLSFASNVGDSPDDWYIIYKDPETSLIKAAAYIVTFSKDREEAEENPHAIVYSNYTAIDNVSFATTWSFHNWNSNDGLGEKLGEARISNIEFFKPSKGYFKAEENSKILNRP